MLKKICMVLLLPLCGCLTKDANTAVPAASGSSTDLLTAGAATTVEDDSTDGTLSCGTLRSSPVHGDTSEAFHNLSVAAVSQPGALIVGYGSPGTLCTGRASQCNSVDTSMNSFDVDDWKNSAHLIESKFSKLTLLACNVGQFQDGADFIARLANETKTPVRAPTGLVWCQDQSLIVEPKTEWLEAEPGKQPKPISGPVYIVPVLTSYLLSINGELKEVPVSATRITQFEYAGIPKYHDTTLNADEAASFAKQLDFGHPFTRTAHPLAAVTAHITLSVQMSGKPVITKRYVLYADAILRDLDAKNLYYRVDSRLHGNLQKLRTEQNRKLLR